MTTLIAIDPGGRTGYAVFRDGMLMHAVVCSPEEMDVYGPADLVVIENPQIYPRSKARPDSILKLARIVGRYEERFKKNRIRLVTPREWKGTIDGDIMVSRIKAAMTPLEHQVLAAYTGGYAHNAVDAIGLGKWALRQPWGKP